MNIRAISATAAASVMVVALAACSSSAGNNGQDYPRQTITIVVPFDAGGGSDSIARRVASALEDEIDATVLVENKPGAGSVVGTDYVSKSKSDGYTLLSTNSFAFTAQQELRDSSYTTKDFDPIGEEAEYGLVQLVKADSQWGSLDDMLQDEQKVTYGHPGVGGMLQVAQAALVNEADVSEQGVPFDGSAPAITALLGGQVDTVAAEVGVALPYIKSGKLKAIGVSTPERVPEIPDVPTFEEAGYDDASITASEVLLAPAGTPKAVVQKLEKAVQKVTESQEYSDYLKKSVYETGDTAGADLDNQLTETKSQVTGLIKLLNITVEN